MSDHSSPHLVIGRLQKIDAELAEKQNEYESAAGDRARLIRKWEKRLAIAHLKAKGPNADSRKASALVTATEQDELFDELMDAEGRYEALRVLTRVLETRATIGQSILRAQGRS